MLMIQKASLIVEEAVKAANEAKENNPSTQKKVKQMHNDTRAAGTEKHKLAINKK